MFQSENQFGDHENDIIQENLEGFEVPLKKEKKKLSRSTYFVLRLNGLLQQRVMIEYAQGINKHNLKIAQEEGDEQEIQKLKRFIELNEEDILDYENRILRQEQIGQEKGYELRFNPRTGRSMIHSAPSEKLLPRSIQKVREGIEAYFDKKIEKLNDQLNEIDAQLTSAQQEQARQLKERKYVDLSTYFSQIEEINKMIKMLNEERETMLEVVEKNASDDE